MRDKIKTAGILLLIVLAAVGGCVIGMNQVMAGREKAPTEETAAAEETAGQRTDENTAAGQQTDEDTAVVQQADEDTAAAAETAQIDLAALREKNPDIFAWLSVPGTEINCPVLQSEQADTFYETHNADGEEDAAGAVYIELANLTSMCDFNTVLHGKTGEEGTGPFADLYRFTDPEFFEDHETVYLYLDGNVLTYEIFAACERENTSLIRTYDFTYQSGCRQFLSDLYGNKDRRMNLREGWEGVSEYNYIITLTTQKEEGAERQFIVTAVLVRDEAGTISRIVAE